MPVSRYLRYLEQLSVIFFKSSFSFCFCKLPQGIKPVTFQPAESLSCSCVTGYPCYVAFSCHSLDSLFGDDPGGGSVEDLLEALQLEPVHPAGRHNALVTPQQKPAAQSVTSVCHMPLHKSCATSLPAEHESNQSTHELLHVYIIPRF